METRESAADSRFEKLKKFDFRHSTVFQEGWSKIKAVLPPEKLFESLVKAQVFFYSREVKPVNLEEYRKWLTDQGTDTDVYIKSYIPEADSENLMKASECDTIETKQDSVRAGKHPDSFAELIEMIQNGLTLPDTEGPEIEPNNDDPTPPVVERKKKPWEIM